MSENAREYKLRLPTFDELTDDQKNAVNAQKPIKLSGLAGTGKSVVSIWRHVENIKNSKNSVLICFNKTLHRYLWLATKEVDKVHNTSASNKVHTLYGFAARYIGKDDSGKPKFEWGGDCRGWQVYCQNGQKLDEIIIDEAQDLEYMAFKALRDMSDDISCGADYNQNINKSIIEEKLEDFLKQNKNGFSEIILYDNYRNSYHIANFIAAFIPQIDQSIPTLNELKFRKEGVRPYIYINENNDVTTDIDIIKDLIKRFSEGSIAVLLPYATQNDLSVECYYDRLKTFGATKYHNEMKKDEFQLSGFFITTFKSAKGLEFDTVIIPRIDYMDEYLQKGKKADNYKEYYVALSRARTNLYLISNKELSKLECFHGVNSELYEVEYFE